MKQNYSFGRNVGLMLIMVSCMLYGRLISELGVSLFWQGMSIMVLVLIFQTWWWS